MAQATKTQIPGKQGEIVVHEWAAADPDFVVLLSHGYGEHARRYDHVADALVEAGGAVYAPDHYGHGESEGTRALVENFEDIVDDVAKVEELARSEHPGKPFVVLGHSMGGLISTLLVQRDTSKYDVLVLSGPIVGGNPEIFGLLDLPELPEIPLDPAALSRDPATGEQYANDELVYHGPFLRPTLESFKAAVPAIANGPSFGALPTLWLHGESDPLAPYEVTKGAMAHLRGDTFEEKMYPGAMHEIFNETNRDEVIGDAVAFVKKHVAA